MMTEKMGPQVMHGLGLLTTMTLKAIVSDLEHAEEESWMACPEEFQALEEVRAEIEARRETK